MKLFCLVILLALLILAPTAAQAASFEKFDIEAQILDDNIVKYRLEMKLDEPLIKLNYPFSFRIKNLTTVNDFGRADCNLIQRGRVSDVECEFSGMTKDRKTLIMEFYTEGDISVVEEKRRYFANYFVRLPINKTSVLVRLPDRGTLSEQPTNNSYYPGDGSVRTDGRYIMVFWEKNDISIGDTLTFSASYVITGGEFGIFYNTIALLAIIIVIILIGIFWLFLRHRTLTKKSAKEVLVSVLDKDEKIVYDILSNHSGSAGQKIIVRESNFSKAKVSRVVKRLKSRNIVDIEPISGRENKIILREGIKKPEQQKPTAPNDQNQNTNQQTGQTQQ